MSVQAVAAPAPRRGRRAHTARCRARRALWRLVYSLAGGLTVTGTRPQGPAVVVANHTSHADTAALLGALPTDTRPVVAAAADYWFEVSWRRALVTSVVAAVPVKRGEGGGYAALRDAVAPAIRDGRVVVIYPEGTRSTDGRLAEFRSGAMRLANELGVPVIPAAVVGTDQVFPKHGRIRRLPVEVRFGAAARGTSPAAARQEVVDLLGLGPARAPATSRLHAAVRARVDAPTVLGVAASWGLAEALSWPVIAEMSLVLFAVAAPRRILRIALCLAAGSVAGVVLHSWLAWHGVHPPLPLTTVRMRAAAQSELATRGGWGVLGQALNGIPVKVYAAQSRAAGVTPWQLGLGAVVGRSARILAVALALRVAAEAVQPWLRRWYGWYLAAVVPVFVLLLALTVRSWA